jgi:uncharacterized protein (UPF0276 family)
MAKRTPKADESEPTGGCRIRQRDTGAVRELTRAQWKKEKATLEKEGYVLVDTHDQPVADED